MNENRQIFVNAYLTNGYNATQAYKTAYPNCKSGQDRNGHRLLSFDEVRKAIDKATEYLKIAWKDRINQVISRAQKEMDNTTSVSALCLLMNAQKGYMDMQAKNQGEYEADNAQKAEAEKLTKEQALEAKEIAKWRLLKGTG
jgi:phage terminase small subunit